MTGLSEPDKSEDSNKRHNPWKFVHLGLQLTVTCLIFFGIGYGLDQRYGWAPWGLLIGGIIGIAVGLYHFLKETL